MNKAIIIPIYLRLNRRAHHFFRMKKVVEIETYGSVTKKNGEESLKRKP